MGFLFECGTSDGLLGKENDPRANSLFFCGGEAGREGMGGFVPLTLVYLIPIICSQLTALALACTFCTFFFFLFALLSIPLFVKRTRAWHGGNPQPTGPSGPPSSAFCSKIIPPPPPRHHHPLPQSLCDGASSGGGAASRSVGRLACEAAKLPCPSLLMPSLPRRPRSLS